MPVATDKPWLRITGGDGSEAEILDQMSRTISQITDFEKLLPPGSSIERVSSEQVDGVTTTRYDVVADIEAVLAQAEEDEQRQAAQAAQQLGLTTLNYSVWLDADNLPRKAEMVSPTPGGRTTMRMLFSDWGEPVELTAPGPDQVQEVDASQLYG